MRKSQKRRRIANNLLEKFVKQLRKSNPKEEVYVLGDFNEGFNNSWSRKVYSAWLEKESIYHFPSQKFKHQKEYSYISERWISVLDHVISTKPYMIEEIIIPKIEKNVPDFRDEVSDHLPVIAIIQRKVSK